VTAATEYPYPDEPKPRPLASDEQAKYLEVRLNEAQEQIGRARQSIEEWEPVAASCRAGLEALSRHQHESIEAVA
jgi:hypothetical protein